MINNLPAFVPYLDPPYPMVAGLRIFVGPGYVYISAANATVYWPGAFVNVAPLSITYIFLNMTTGAVQSNTSGFAGNVYPIAIVSTNQTLIFTLQDVRPDVFGAAGGGGGGGADTVLPLTTSGTFSMTLGQSYFCPVSDGITQALPTPTGMAGQSIKYIKRGSGAAITLTGAENGTVYLSNQYQYVIFETDGTIWDNVGGN